jgi:hypothetical protein
MASFAPPPSAFRLTLPIPKKDFGSIYFLYPTTPRSNAVFPILA